MPVHIPPPQTPSSTPSPAPWVPGCDPDGPGSDAIIAENTARALKYVGLTPKKKTPPGGKKTPPKKTPSATRAKKTPSPCHAEHPG